MSTAKAVKYFCFARFSNCKIIHQVIGDTKNSDSYKSEAQKVLNQLQSIKLAKDERQKINSTEGPWYCIQDDKEIVYLMLTS